MRTFQFSDAKSHKFWTIDVNGTDFTVTYGKVGTAGQTQTKSFPNADKARAEADKLIREKTGKGYRETTPTDAPSDGDALEKGLIEHRNETVRWNVYSDFLAERGDPRGEFMRVQLALEDEKLSAKDRKDLAAQEKKFLAAHASEWLGPLAAYTVDAKPIERHTNSSSTKGPPVDYAFERGWLARLDFPNLTVNQARAFAAAKDARLIREVSVLEVAAEAPEGSTQQYIDSYYAPGPDVPEGVDSYDGPGLHALCRCPHLAAVRTFRLGERVENQGGDEYYNCHTSGELAFHLVKQMPHIEDLELYAHRVDANKLFVLPMPDLKSLVLFHSSSYPLDKLASNKSLTKLETIRCHPHAVDFDDEEPGAYIKLKHLKTICRSEHLKSLTHLCLRLTDFGDAGAKEIVASGILKRLRVLDLQGGCMSDVGAKALAACPDLKNLEYLNLRSNALTADGIAAIQATKVKANVLTQHTTTAFDPEDGDVPEYLYDGDIE